MRTLWQRLRSAWVSLTGTGAAATVAFGLLVFASLLASLAIPRESVGLRNAALQHVIAATRGDWTVTATAIMTNTITDEPGQVQATDIAASDASLRSRLAAGGVKVAANPPAWSGLTTDYIHIAGAAQPAGYGPPQFEMIYRTALARYSHVVAGRLPAGGAATGIAQAAVTTTTAARFGLRVGTRLHAGPLQLVVTGIITPTLQDSAFWGTDHLAASPALTPATSALPSYWTGALFIGPGSLQPVESSLVPTMNATWWYPAALGHLTADQASGLAASVGSLVSSGTTVSMPGLGGPAPVTVTSQIPSNLSQFIAGESAAAPVLELLYVSLAVLGAVVVLLGARLVGQRRSAEFTLMRARGAALYQLGWRVLRPSVVIAAAAGAAAAALAIGLTPGDGEAVGWWLAGIAIAVTLAGPVLISVVPQRVAAPATGRPGRPGGSRKPAARRIVIETALVAVAIGGLVVLRNQGVSSGSSALYPSAAPALVAIPVAVVVLRCYPPLARELARVAGLSRGVVAFVGLARATRTPPGTVLPSFALVLVLAMVAFPDMVSTSVAHSQAAASWQQVGADAIIQAPPGQEVTPALQHQISSVPGVVSTAAAVVGAGTLPTGSELSAVFVDPARYAAVVDQAPGPRFPLSALSGNAGRGQAASTAPAVTTAAGAQLVGTAPTSLSVGTSPIQIQLTGRIDGVPGVAGTWGQPARADTLAGFRSRAGCGAADRGCPPRAAGRVGNVARDGPRRAEDGAGAPGGADGPHAGNGGRGWLRRAGPAAFTAAHRPDPRDDAGAPGDDGPAALAGPVAAGGRDTSPGRGRRHRWRRVCLAARAIGRAVAEPGGVQRDRVGHCGGSRPIAPARFRGRALAGRAARPGRSGRYRLSPRQRQLKEAQAHDRDCRAYPAGPAPRRRRRDDRL
jgi:putative ABC transport system permease protein